MPKRAPKRLVRFLRADGIEVREVGDELFLVAPQGAIHKLDRTASAAWRALSVPRSGDDIVALFQIAFPDAPKRRIAKDIADLLALLQKRHLIIRTNWDC
jgi:hypothetical protein